MVLWAQWTACRGHSHCCWSRNIKWRRGDGCWEGKKPEVSVLHISFHTSLSVLCGVSCTLSWCFCPGSVQLRLPCCAASLRVVLQPSPRDWILFLLAPTCLSTINTDPRAFFTLSSEGFHHLSRSQASTNRLSRIWLCFWKIAKEHCAVVPVNSLY